MGRRYARAMESQGQNPPPGQQPVPTTPPGWYPDAAGTTRWWDGQQWGPSAPSQGGGMDGKSLAVLAQVLGILTGFLGPLVIYLVNGDKDPFVRHHSAEALNFQLTVLIGYVISFVLMFVLIGFLTFFAIWVMAIVFGIMAAVAANRGEWYRDPINIRMVSGALG